MRDFRAGAPRDQARLKDRVALVTGASRGGGKGSALVLGEEGATVYVTGRSVRGGPTTLGRPGTIDDTAEELSARGGTGIAVRCDHTDDSQVEALFERIRGEQGRLDVLVNNAWSGYELPLYYETPFWEMEWRHWDLMFQGGLRATAFASTLAAPMMIEAGRGLIHHLGARPPARGHVLRGREERDQQADRTNGGRPPAARRHLPRGLARLHAARADGLEPRGRGEGRVAGVPRGAIAALATDADVLEKSGGMSPLPPLLASTASPTSTASSSRRSGTNTGRAPEATSSHRSRGERPRIG
jgi:short chain dehydrogenase